MKKIKWEYWNNKEKEMVDSLEGGMEDQKDDLEDKDYSSFFTPLKISDSFTPISTPFGSVPADSLLKPSDRWECWIGYTNFDITHDIRDIIKMVDGVEALKVMGRYTFCVGVGKMFNFTEVRIKIESLICEK